MPGFNFDQSAALTASSIGSGLWAVANYARPKDMHSKLFTSPVADDEVMRHMGVAMGGITALTTVAAMAAGDSALKKDLCAAAGAGWGTCVAQTAWGVHKEKVDKKMGTISAVAEGVVCAALLAKGLEGRFNKK